MSNFILFFTQKEGTSAIIRILDHFERIGVVHQIENEGFEPFNDHNCGPMPLSALEECLEMIFAERPIDFDALNRIYTRTATRPLEKFAEADTVGFKMRFVPPVKGPRLLDHLGPLKKRSRALVVNYQVEHGRFRHIMLGVLKKYDVRVLMAVRQDVFRWALSRYHGDGSGRPGHPQFAFADREGQRQHLGRIHVDCERFESLVRHCEALHERKKRLVLDLKQKGIAVYPLLYEDFVDDPTEFFRSLLKRLGTERSPDEIEQALAHGTALQRVHSGSVSEYVVNHQQIVDRFGGRFVRWERAAPI
jgi:hypothetical protein